MMTATTDYDAFVHFTTHRSVPMHIVVLNGENRVARTYDVPAGFSLERYLASVFPTAQRRFSYEGTGVKASLVVGGQTVETHVGFHRLTVEE